LDPVLVNPKGVILIGAEGRGGNKIGPVARPNPALSGSPMRATLAKLFNGTDFNTQQVFRINGDGDITNPANTTASAIANVSFEMAGMGANIVRTAKSTHDLKTVRGIPTAV